MYWRDRILAEWPYSSQKSGSFLEFYSQQSLQNRLDFRVLWSVFRMKTEFFAEAHSESCQKSKAELFAKLFNGFKLDYFPKILHLGCLTGFWIRFCYSRLPENTLLIPIMEYKSLNLFSFFRRLLARNVKELLIFCSVLDGCRCSVLNVSENRSKLVEQMYSTAENIWFLNFRRLVHVSDADANLSDKCKRHLSKPLGVAERVLFPLPHLYLFLHWYRNIDVINKEELIYQQICLIFIIDMYLFCFISIEILKHRNFVFGCYLFSAYISEYCKILYHCEKTLCRKTSASIFLTYFWPTFPFYTPWKHQRTKGFLVFRGGIEW